MNKVEYLTSLGCCPRCVLVYFGVRGSEHFISYASATLALQALSKDSTEDAVEDTTGDEALVVGSVTSEVASSEPETTDDRKVSESNGTGMNGSSVSVISEAPTEEEPMKCDKEQCSEGPDNVAQLDMSDALTNEPVCISCLGLLQNSCCSVAAIEQVCEPTLRAGYDAPCFSLSVCLPVSLTARTHVIASRLSQHTGKAITKEQRTGLTAHLKDAWKSSVGGSAAAVLGKQCSAGEALLSVPVTAHYMRDAEECHAFMVAVGYTGATLKRQRNRKQKFYSYGKHKKAKENGSWDKDSSTGSAASVECRPPSVEGEEGAVVEVAGPEYSRQAVESVLSGLSVEDVACCPLAPAPEFPLSLIPDTPNRVSVFVAGRYRKFNREVSQTPWLLHGELKCLSSVEELIAGPLMPVLGATEVKFLSSGREDVDVRCLGRGRPFALEVINPRVTSLEVAQLKQLQKKINSSKDISVTDLQMMEKEGTSVLRYNTEDKVKNYCALCAVRDGGEPVTATLLEKLHGITPLTVRQETPLRVLHRRPMLTRTRVVYNMTTERVNDTFFKVHMRTEAGTYIKELVHGDFGRTQPNLSGLLGRPVDILALDVMEVELDWPPPVGESEQ